MSDCRHEFCMECAIEDCECYLQTDGDCICPTNDHSECCG